jgi:hypothetical protein
MVGVYLNSVSLWFAWHRGTSKCLRIWDPTKFYFMPSDTRKKCRILLCYCFEYWLWRCHLCSSSNVDQFIIFFLLLVYSDDKGCILHRYFATIFLALKITIQCFVKLRTCWAVYSMLCKLCCQLHSSEIYFLVVKRAQDIRGLPRFWIQDIKWFLF